MLAFIEWLCEHSAIVRVGPACDRYGAPFEAAAAIRIEGRKAILKGLSGSVRLPHVRAAVRAVRHLGYQACWERVHGDRVRVFSTDTAVRGRAMSEFTMKISVTIEKDGKPFANYDANYHNMDYQNMQAVQSTLVGGLVKLGDEKAAQLRKVA